MNAFRWLLLPVLILASCDKDDSPTPPQNAGPLFPLTIGSTWDHVYTSYDETGKIVDTYHDITRVESQSEIDGVKWSVIPSSKSTELTSWAMKSDGVWIMPAGVEPFLLFKYPAKLGDDAYLARAATMKVTGVDFTQQFPIGLLDHCYKYDMFFIGGGERWYVIKYTLAANVGPVEIAYFKESTSTLPGLKAILSSYTIK
jgi:hypothetical protein